ncbi:MAG: acetyl-CoA hydrolase/transferase C-terminal domain-containing protein [Pseudomonadota bacterium]
MSSTTLESAFASLRKSLPADARLYVAGCSGEPLPLVETLKAAPNLAAGLTFLGIWIPGVNQTDWAGLHPTSKAESIFISPALRSSFEAGRTHFHPLSYTQSTAWLSRTKLDAGVVMISPPDADGMVSLGVSADFSPIIIERQDVRLLGIINHSLTAPANGPKFPIERFEAIVETDCPLASVSENDLPETFAQIGAHIAALCNDGDALQFGLGNVQQAVLKALHNHRDLKIHAGMISTPLTYLIEQGAIADGLGAVTTGVAIGTPEFYERAAVEERIRYAPVSYTHAISTLSQLPNFKAINSCIEIDLFGQANAEFINGRQISGTGGLVDFLRGAAASPTGRGILALTSTAKKGTISRIVPRLPRNATSISRADVDTVVTEHGVAELKHKSIDARAEALITIADPSYRDQLYSDWREIRKSL